MNEEIKEKLKTKIAISQIKNEEEKAMNKKENFIFKNIGIAACVLMSLTGVVFAGSKVIENIWKTPEKVQISSGDLEEITKIMMAIGNHDENTGTAVSDISAALILADKSDVHRDRVVNKNISTFDIHDRVN